jgi:hypothetical protein
MRGEAVDLFGWFLSATWLCEPGPLKPGSGYAINLLVSGEPGPGCFEDRASLDQNLYADNQTHSSYVHSLAHSNQTVVVRIPRCKHVQIQAIKQSNALSKTSFAAGQASSSHAPLAQATSDAECIVYAPISTPLIKHGVSWCDLPFRTSALSARLLPTKYFFQKKHLYLDHDNIEYIATQQPLFPWLVLCKCLERVSTVMPYLNKVYM